MENNVLKAPANHNLVDIFKELKYGRPAESQKYLDKCIEELTTVEKTYLDYLTEGVEGYPLSDILCNLDEEQFENAAKEYAYDKLLNFINKTFKAEW